MEKKILVINGHPDPRPERFCAALCDAYLQGAATSGFDGRRLSIGSLAPVLAIPASQHPTEGRSEMTSAFDLMRWADQLVLIFPLWVDQPPSLLHQFFTHADRSARIGSALRKIRMFVTMEFPAFANRSRYGGGRRERARSLDLPGLSESEPTFIGSVGMISMARRQQWLRDVHHSGTCGT